MDIFFSLWSNFFKNTSSFYEYLILHRNLFYGNPCKTQKVLRFEISLIQILTSCVTNPEYRSRSQEFVNSPSEIKSSIASHVSATVFCLLRINIDVNPPSFWIMFAYNTRRVTLQQAQFELDADTFPFERNPWIQLN